VSNASTTSYILCSLELLAPDHEEFIGRGLGAPDLAKQDHRPPEGVILYLRGRLVTLSHGWGSSNAMGSLL
jgi:hypothetical protein